MRASKVRLAAASGSTTSDGVGAGCQLVQLKRLFSALSSADPDTPEIRSVAQGDPRRVGETDSDSSISGPCRVTRVRSPPCGDAASGGAAVYRSDPSTAIRARAPPVPVRSCTTADLHDDLHAGRNGTQSDADTRREEAVSPASHRPRSNTGRHGSARSDANRSGRFRNSGSLSEHNRSTMDRQQEAADLRFRSSIAP